MTTLVEVLLSMLRWLRFVTTENLTILKRITLSGLITDFIKKFGYTWIERSLIVYKKHYPFSLGQRDQLLQFISILTSWLFDHNSFKSRFNQLCAMIIAHFVWQSHNCNFVTTIKWLKVRDLSNKVIVAIFIFHKICVSYAGTKRLKVLNMNFSSLASTANN